MLYLAEVEPKGSFRKASIQLLAKQQADQTWVPANEGSMAVEDASRFNAGVLVLVEIGSNRQVQQLREASKQLVGILQNFSRLQEKSRLQEEEIDQWKQSLTFQSQELNRREIQLESREEELQQIESEYKQYESAVEELRSRRSEIDALEKNLAEQQQAMGEQRRQLQLREEQLAQFSQSGYSGLGATEAAALKGLAQQLLGSLQPHEGISGQTLASLQDAVSQRVQQLEEALQQLESDRQQTQARQAELDRALTAWQSRREDLEKTRADVIARSEELRISESISQNCRDGLAKLSSQISVQEAASQHIYALIHTYDFIEAVGQEVPAPSTPQVSVEELTQQVKRLQGEYEQHAALVNQQESELEQNRQTLTELQHKLEGASAGDRLEIEGDIDYAKSACTTLEVSLAPQKKTLQRMQQELTDREALLRRLKGDANNSSGFAIPTVDMGPVLARVEEHKRWMTAEKARLEAQLQQHEASWNSQQESLDRMRQEFETIQASLSQEEAALLAQRLDLSASWERLNVREELRTNEQQFFQNLKDLLERLEGGLTEVRGEAESIHTEIANLVREEVRA